MNLSKAHTFTRAGRDDVVLDAQERVVGVLKCLDDNLYGRESKRLTGAFKRVSGGDACEPIQYHESKR